MIRPQNLHPVTAEMQTMPEPMHGGPGLAGTVSDVVVTGSLTKLYVQVPDTDAIVVAFPTRASAPEFTVGQNIALGWRESDAVARSGEHTSELPSLMRISYAGFCLKKQN